MVTLEDVREGSIVVIRGGFGSEPPQAVRLTSVEADIKNGRPGCDYIDRKGSGRWAYLSQIDEVLTY